MRQTKLFEVLYFELIQSPTLLPRSSGCLLLELLSLLDLYLYALNLLNEVLTKLSFEILSLLESLEGLHYALKSQRIPLMSELLENLMYDHLEGLLYRRKLIH
jgi:hypothetical protein